MPASATISSIEAPSKPCRAKQTAAAAKILAVCWSRYDCVTRGMAPGYGGPGNAGRHAGPTKRNERFDMGDSGHYGPYRKQ